MCIFDPKVDTRTLIPLSPALIAICDRSLVLLDVAAREQTSDEWEAEHTYMWMPISKANATKLFETYATQGLEICCTLFTDPSGDRELYIG